MYKHILVAIDDSAASARALEEARLLARTHQARLTIAHVADETLMGMHNRTFSTTLNLDQARQAIVEAGKKLLADAQAQISETRAEILLLEARNRRVSEVISDAIREQQADLLVIGTHGRSGLQKLILGSVAEQLLRLADISVLLVRKAA